MLDLNGNGLLDFVMHRQALHADEDPLLGRNHWLVFANTGSGFATQPTTWQIPCPLRGPFGDHSMPATQAHGLLDLNDDGAVDFVMNREGERTTEDPLVGRNHWLIFHPN